MRSPGFTIIEILVVIAIIGILATLASGSFRGLIAKYEIERQMREIQSDMMRSRMEAMHRNRNVFFSLSSTSYAAYEDSHPSPYGNGQLDPGEDSPLLPERSVKYPIAFSGGGLIAFDSKGFVKTTGATVCVFSDVNPSYDCIKVSSTRISLGKMKSQSGPCNADNCEEEE